MLRLQENVFECLELCTLPDSIVVLLQWFLAHYLVQILVQALEVPAQTMHEILDCMLSLGDSLLLFFCVLVAVGLGSSRRRN